jgi:hypothetical protein
MVRQIGTCDISADQLCDHQGYQLVPGCSRQPDNHLRNFARFGELLTQACGGPVRLSLTPRLLLAEHNAADGPAAKEREE